jgi:predicted TIM-barrel fold metal-dependent hydrolase
MLACGPPRYGRSRDVLVPGHRDLELRQRVLDEYGIDTQVLTFTTPGVHVEMPELAIELARQINDEFAAIVRTREKRFAALATLPLNDPESQHGSWIGR